MTVEPTPAEKPAAEIVVYWRPGCGFCRSLLRQFERLSVPHRLVNIWEDPSGVEFVRSVARGNETVPTVAIGQSALVNPTIDEVLGLAARHAPHAIPDDYEPPTPSRLGGFVHRLLGGD